MGRPTIKALIDGPGVQLILTSRKLAAVPEAIRARTDLTHLGLQKNQLRTLPDWIGELTALTSLYVGDNPLETLPDALGTLPALDRLLLDNTPLRTLPEGLAQSPMTSLHLSGTTALDWPRAFALLARCPRLSVLAINSNPGMVEHLDGLRQLTSLRQVFLTMCGLTTVPEVLGEMPGLITVSLADNPITSIPDALVLAPGLQLLIVAKTQVSAAERKRIKALRPGLMVS